MRNSKIGFVAKLLFSNSLPFYILISAPIASAQLNKTNRDRHILFAEKMRTVEITVGSESHTADRLKITWPNGFIEKRSAHKNRFRLISYSFKSTQGWANAEFYWSAIRKAYLPLHFTISPYETHFYSSNARCQKTNFSNQFDDIFLGFKREEFAPFVKESNMIDSSCKSPAVSLATEEGLMDSLALIFGSDVGGYQYIGCLAANEQPEFASAIKGQIYLLTQSATPVISCKAELEIPPAKVEMPNCNISLSGVSNGGSKVSPDILGHEIVHCAMQPTPLPKEVQEKFTADVISCCGMDSDKTACDRISQKDKAKLGLILSEFQDMELVAISEAIKNDKIYSDDYKEAIATNYKSRMMGEFVDTLEQNNPECLESENKFSSRNCTGQIRIALEKAARANSKLLCDSLSDSNSVPKDHCEDALSKVEPTNTTALWKVAHKDKGNRNRAREVPLTENQREAMTVAAQAGMVPELPRIAEQPVRVALETNTNGTLDPNAYAALRGIADGAARESDSMWERVSRTVLPEAQATTLAQAESGASRAPASVGSVTRENRNGRAGAARKETSLPSVSKAPARAIAFQRLGFDMKPMATPRSSGAEPAKKEIPKVTTIALAPSPRKPDNFARVDSLLNSGSPARAEDTENTKAKPNSRAVASLPPPQGSPNSMTGSSPTTSAQTTRLIGSGAKPVVPEPNAPRQTASVNPSRPTTSRFSEPIVRNILTRGSRHGATELKGILITDPNFSNVLANMNYQIVDWDAAKTGTSKKPKVYGTEKNPVAMFEIRNGKLLKKTNDPDGNGT